MVPKRMPSFVMVMASGAWKMNSRASVVASTVKLLKTGDAEARRRTGMPRRLPNASATRLLLGSEDFECDPFLRPVRQVKAHAIRGPVAGLGPDLSAFEPDFPARTDGTLELRI